MKILNQNIKVIFLFVLIVSASSCSKTDDSSDTDDQGNPEASNINDYIQGLNFDPSTVLNTHFLGSDESELTISNQSSYDGWIIAGNETACVETQYELKANFYNIAILKPIEEFVYPGALINVNQNMLLATPDSLQIDRKPIKLNLNLPNMGSNSSFVIDDPSTNINVGESIVNALEWWNDNAYQDNYIDDDSSTYNLANAYSKKQMGIDLGICEEWANSDNFEDLSITSNSQKVSYMVVKRVFYTVGVDAPQFPADFFSNEVTLEEVQSKMDDNNPPAFISSVDYGKIIMFRIRSYDVFNPVNLSDVLEYAAGIGEVSGINNEYDNIIDSSDIHLISVDPNAEEFTLQYINSEDLPAGPGALTSFIDEVTYSANNPGIPIGFEARYLKDNTLVTSGYTENYTTEVCSIEGPYNHEEIHVENDSFHDTRFYFEYRSLNEISGSYEESPVYEINQGDDISVAPPDGAHSITIKFQWQYGAGDWNNITLDGSQEYVNVITQERCYEFRDGNIWEKHLQFIL